MLFTVEPSLDFPVNISAGPSNVPPFKFSVLPAAEPFVDSPAMIWSSLKVPPFIVIVLLVASVN